MSKLRVISPDGQPGTIDETQLADALKQGFKQPVEALVPDAVAEVGNAIGTGALGALSGATAGLSDVALAKKPELRQFVGAQYEQNPGSKMLGEVAGMLVSPVNALAPAIEGARAATVAGRLAQKATSGAALGSLYGAGNTLSEAALGDTQLTAEKLLAGAGLGALLGGLGGGVGGAVEEGAAKVLPKLATMLKGGQSVLDDVANDAAISSTRAKQSAIDKLGPDRLEAVAKVLRDNDHIKLTPAGTRDSAAAHRETLGRQLGKVLEDVDAAGAKPAHAQTLTRLDEWFKGLNSVEQDTIRSELQSARRGVEALEKKGGSFREFDELKRSIQEKAKFSGPAPVDNQALRLKRELAGVFRDELDQQILPALGADAGKVFIDTKATYGALRDAERLAKSGMSRAKPGGFGLGLYDLLAGVAGAGIHPMGLAAAYGSKVLREQGPAIIARVADRLAKSPALTAAAASFAAAVPATAPQLGRYGPALMLAAEQSPHLALAQHMVTAQLDPEYAANAQLAGLTPESPAEHAAGLDRASQLAAIKGAVEAHDTAISEAVANIASGKRPAKSTPVLKLQDFGAKRMRQDSAEGFRRRVDEIRTLASQPQALIDRTASNLEGFGDVAPAVAAQMTAMADRAVKYLAAQAEVPPKPGPMAREWVSTPTERHSFTLKLRAVQAPMSILEDAARGTLVKSQVEAVRAVYPSLMLDIEQKALERMVSGEKMPHRARQMLTMLTGVDADGTMSPRAIAANQRAIMNEQGKPSQQLGATDGKDLGDSSRMATPAQRRELATETG